jgi:hypothetical protein
MQIKTLLHSKSCEEQHKIIQKSLNMLSKRRVKKKIFFISYFDIILDTPESDESEL